MTAGDVIALCVGIVAALIALGSVAVAVRANRRADEANVTAAEANRIAKESLEAQRQALPPAWSPDEGLDKGKPVFRNQSGRHVIVESLGIEPDGTANRVKIRSAFPERIEYGDSLEFYVQRVMGPNPTKAIIRWRYEGEDEIRETERLL